jgi:hypothetical protein
MKSIEFNGYLATFLEISKMLTSSEAVARIITTLIRRSSRSVKPENPTVLEI